LESLLPNPGKPIAGRGNFFALFCCLQPGKVFPDLQGYLFLSWGRRYPSIEGKIPSCKDLVRIPGLRRECPGKLQEATMYTNRPQKSSFAFCIIIWFTCLQLKGDIILTSFKSVGHLYKVTKKVTELFNMQSKLILLYINTYISAPEESHPYIKILKVNIKK
jgi:hypothetical protein